MSLSTFTKIYNLPSSETIGEMYQDVRYYEYLEKYYNLMKIKELAPNMINDNFRDFEKENYFSFFRKSSFDFRFERISSKSSLTDIYQNTFNDTNHQNYPSFNVSEKAIEYINSSMIIRNRIVRLVVLLSEVIPTPIYEISLVEDKEGGNSIIVYSIPSQQNVNKFEYEDSLIEEILKIYPEEEFLDFMIQVIGE